MNTLKLPDFVFSYGFRFDKKTDLPHVAATRGRKASLQTCSVEPATFARLGFVKPEQRNLLTHLKCVFSSRLTQGKRAAGRYEAYLHGEAKQKDVAFMKLLQQLAYARKAEDAQTIRFAMLPEARMDFLQHMKTIVDAARTQQIEGNAAADGRPTAERVNILEGIRSVVALWQNAISADHLAEYELVRGIQAGIADVETGRNDAVRARKEKVWNALTNADNYSDVLGAVRVATHEEAVALINYAAKINSDKPLDNPVGPAILALCAYRRFGFTGETAAKLKLFAPLFQHPDHRKLFRYGPGPLDIIPSVPEHLWHYFKRDGLWYEQISSDRSQSRRLFAPASQTV
ncbi:hypothetical protein [Duganella qianjiadongensis]|uniref:DUF3644 domain-containing protein n=1 Tax=Duganella qianjiadongensis TaxID=2692176 RepID=A0ABW9VGG7_9BURK|nr:hypothetical protein [Duganella qianjiadongensis]MYM38714.1 hypothetical protein [Duganella qianjiadongensis]